MPLTQQQIRDRLDSFCELTQAAVAAARDRETARQQVEKRQLQDECGAIGHVFTQSRYGAQYGRLCGVCDMHEPTPSVASNLTKG